MQNSSNTSCQAGYYGPLCQSCLRDQGAEYYKQKDSCYLCREKKSEIPFFVCMILLYLTLYFLIMR